MVWRRSLSTCCCCKTAVLWPLACSIRKAFDQVNTSYFDFPKNKHQGQVLWDRNPGFLKSEIGPFSDFKEKSYLMGLKSAHFQEYDFQESGVGDRFLKMGTHFQERSGSLENGLCVTCSGFWVCPGYLWLLIVLLQWSKTMTRSHADS